MTKEIIPSNSRYLPFVQQPYCCVPACLQTILYKNKLDVLAQELIGSYLGLVVPPEAGSAFYNVKTSEQPLVKSGFGTRIQEPGYGIEALIAKEKWPLSFRLVLASELDSESKMIELLTETESKDEDAFVCFQNDGGGGHVCVFDRIVEGLVRIIDPESQYPKWRMIKFDELFSRIQAHGDSNAGGLWVFSKA